MERALRAANVTPASAEATARAASSSVEVGTALLPELRRLGNDRLNGDADFDADRFPNAERYFHGAPLPPK